MFEKLFKRKKKGEVSAPSKDTSPVLTNEEQEIIAEREEAARISKKVDELDEETVKSVEERIRRAFNEELESDPSNLEEYFDDLDEIKEDLEFDLIRNKKDPVMDTLERKIIAKVFEEILISSGHTLEEYYNWLEQEELDEEVDEEIENHYTR